MARTIAEIKKTITDKYIEYDEVKQAYELEEEKTFEEQFSKVSLESIIFYIIAFVCWTLETLFDAHKEECIQLIDEKKPHRLKWYRDKALVFQLGRPLAGDTDDYDNTGVSEEKIQEERVVKYAAAIEKKGILFIKVAGEGSDKRSPLSGDEKVALQRYFSEVKDAGVRLELINEPANHFSCKIDIYYDPMVLDGEGKRLDGNGNTTVQDAIKSYIENLPFNGEYSNAALVDILQKIEGVVIPELRNSQCRQDASGYETISAKIVPESGYMCINNESTDLSITWKPYQTIAS